MKIFTENFTCFSWNLNRGNLLKCGKPKMRNFTKKEEFTIIKI
jgi:hypothetical protein